MTANAERVAMGAALLKATPWPKVATPEWRQHLEAVRRLVYHGHATPEVRAWALDEAARMRTVMAEREQAIYRAMLACELRAPRVRRLTDVETQADRVCFLCGSDLPAGRRKWCSEACIQTWWTNHEWGGARSAVVARDKVCVECGVGEVCGRCRLPWPCPTRTAGGPDAWGHGPEDAWLQVNHREPRRGEGYGPGCHHHQDNLELLCRPHHVVVTTRQLREWRGTAPRLQDQMDPLWESQG